MVRESFCSTFYGLNNQVASVLLSIIISSESFSLRPKTTLDFVFLSELTCFFFRWGEEIFSVHYQKQMRNRKTWISSHFHLNLAFRQSAVIHKSSTNCGEWSLTYEAIFSNCCSCCVTWHPEERANCPLLNTWAYRCLWLASVTVMSGDECYYLGSWPQMAVFSSVLKLANSSQ